MDVARLAYEAFRDQSKARHWPEWEDVAVEEKACWARAALAVSDYIFNGISGAQIQISGMVPIMIGEAPGPQVMCFEDSDEALVKISGTEE